MFNLEIFKAYDIRGIYGKDFDEEFAGQLGNRIATALGTKMLIIGRDERSSSASLAQAVMNGALQAGARVIDVGMVSTPLFYFAVGQAQAQGGIMITASHNEGDWNGFKPVGQGARIIGGDELKDMFNNQADVTIEGGVLEQKDFSSGYLDKVLASAKSQNLGLKIGLKASGNLLPVLEGLAQRAGIEFIAGYKGGMNIEFDADGDRILFYDTDDRRIASEFIFMLLVRELGWNNVVYDFRFSRSIVEELGRLGVTGTRSLVGRRFVQAIMRQNDAQFAGEISGHFYFKEFNYLEAPELTLLLVLNIVKNRGKTLAELVLPYQQYFQSEEINISVTDQQSVDRIIGAIKDQYAKYQIEEFDGVTVNAWDTDPPAGGWWFNVRTSNTEPLLRVIVEAKNKNLLDQKVVEITSLLQY